MQHGSQFYTTHYRWKDKENVNFRQNFHEIWKFPNVFCSDFLHRTSRKLDDDFHFADFQEARIFVDI